MMPRLTLGIVGCGRVVERFHLPALRSSRAWSIAGVCDSSADRLAWAGQAMPRAGTFPTVEALLSDLALDAVLVASPPAFHSEHVSRCLSAGVSVLVEKPCGLTAGQVLEMASAASANGVQLRVGFNRRFHPSYTSLKERFIRSGRDAEWSIDFRLGFSVPDWHSHSGYLGEAASGGGVLLDVVTHQLDLLAWLRDSAVVELRPLAYDRHSAASEGVRYVVRLADGTRAACVARHGIGYIEGLRAASSTVTLYAGPTRLVEGEANLERSLRRLADRWAWVDRKWMRVGLVQDPMGGSFGRQWEAFANVVRGKDGSSPLAGPDDAIAVHNLIAELAEGLPSVRAASLPVAAGPGQQAKSGSPSTVAQTDGPEASVVLLVGDRRQRAAKALETVLAQKGIEQVEVLLVDLGAAHHQALAGSEHPAVQSVRIGRLRPFGEVRAEAVRRARGKVMIFLEEHCRTSAGWLEAILQAFSNGPWVAVGPRVVSANPGAGFSDAMSMINYGDWAGGHHRAREVDMLPGNNSAYLREALLALDDALDTLLLSDTVLQWRLSEEGGRLFFEPQAVVAHRYPTTLWSAAKGEYLYHVGFGGARAESFGWPWPLRFGYALASPAVALLRLGRLLRGKGDPANVQQTRRNLLAVLALMSAAVLGQAAGVIFGPRAAQSRFTDYELNESRRALGEPPEGS